MWEALRSHVGVATALRGEATPCLDPRMLEHLGVLHAVDGQTSGTPPALGVKPRGVSKNTKISMEVLHTSVGHENITLFSTCLLFKNMLSSCLEAKEVPTFCYLVPGLPSAPPLVLQQMEPVCSGCDVFFTSTTTRQASEHCCLFLSCFTHYAYDATSTKCAFLRWWSLTGFFDQVHAADCQYVRQQALWA